MITPEQKVLTEKEIEHYKQKCDSLEWDKKQLENAQEDDYRLQLIYERLTSSLKESYPSAFDKANLELRSIKKRLTDQEKGIDHIKNEIADFKLIILMLEHSIKD